jgi:hypothetical protein
MVSLKKNIQVSLDKPSLTKPPQSDNPPTPGPAEDLLNGQQSSASRTVNYNKNLSKTDYCPAIKKPLTKDTVKQEFVNMPGESDLDIYDEPILMTELVERHLGAVKPGSYESPDRTEITNNSLVGDEVSSTEKKLSKHPISTYAKPITKGTVKQEFVNMPGESDLDIYDEPILMTELVERHLGAVKPGSYESPDHTEITNNSLVGDEVSSTEKKLSKPPISTYAKPIPQTKKDSSATMKSLFEKVSDFLFAPPEEDENFYYLFRFIICLIICSFIGSPIILLIIGLFI